MSGRRARALPRGRGGVRSLRSLILAASRPYRAAVGRLAPRGRGVTRRGSSLRRGGGSVGPGYGAEMGALLWPVRGGDGLAGASCRGGRSRFEPRPLALRGEAASVAAAGRRGFVGAGSSTRPPTGTGWRRARGRFVSRRGRVSNVPVAFRGVAASLRGPRPGGASRRSSEPPGGGGARLRGSRFFDAAATGWWALRVGVDGRVWRRVRWRRRGGVVAGLGIGAAAGSAPLPRPAAAVRGTWSRERKETAE